MSMLLKHAIDEAFERMARLYGREFTAKFEDGDIDEIKVSWEREVSGIHNVLDAISWALKNLPERCPNAIQFRNLCRQAPDPRRLAMVASNALVRGPTIEELEAMQRLRDGIVFRSPNRQWAYDLVARHGAGDTRVGPGALRMAVEVVEGETGRKPSSDYVPREPKMEISGMNPTGVIVDEYHAGYLGDDGEEPPW